VPITPSFNEPPLVGTSDMNILPTDQRRFNPEILKTKTKKIKIIFSVILKFFRESMATLNLESSHFFCKIVINFSFTVLSGICANHPLGKLKNGFGLWTKKDSVEPA
jgi:hypothetical protein